jgi:hypothetical protein
MAELFSQYASGTQLTAGAITGSAYGVSGLNPIVDRLNSICSTDGIIDGVVSGNSIFPTINSDATNKANNPTTWAHISGVFEVMGSIVVTSINDTQIIINQMYNTRYSQTGFNGDIFLYRSGASPTGTLSRVVDINLGSTPDAYPRAAIPFIDNTPILSGTTVFETWVYVDDGSGSYGKQGGAFIGSMMIEQKSTTIMSLDADATITLV